LLRLARDAVQSDPNDPEILADAANLIAWASGDYEEATQLCTRADAIGANSGFYWFQTGLPQFHCWRWQEPVVSLNKALQLDLLDPIAF
jgi:tetratricopeptide (TPR) repeat protein